MILLISISHFLLFEIEKNIDINIKFNIELQSINQYRGS